MNLFNLTVLAHTICCNLSWAFHQVSKNPLHERSKSSLGEFFNQPGDLQHGQDHKQGKDGGVDQELGQKQFKIEEIETDQATNGEDVSRDPVPKNRTQRIKLRRHRYKIRHSSKRRIQAQLLTFYLKSNVISPLKKLFSEALLKQLVKSKLSKKGQFSTTIRLQ